MSDDLRSKDPASYFFGKKNPKLGIFKLFFFVEKMSDRSVWVSDV